MTDHRILYFCEIAALFRKKQRLIARVFCVGFSLVFLSVFLLTEPLYRAKGVFRQASGGGDTASVQALLRTIQQAPLEGTASGIFQSNRLVAQAAQQSGLQIDQLGFSDVVCSADAPFSFTLVPLDKTHFEVVGMGTGERSIPFEAEELSFTLDEMPRAPLKVHVTPMRQLLVKIHKRLKIRASRHDSNLLEISFKDTLRPRAIAFVDVLMQQYQCFLKEQHEQITLAQMDFLHKRKEQLFEQLQETLDKHVAYLEDEVDSDGYLGLSQEIEMLAEPKETYTAKRHQLDLDIKKWHAPQLEARADHPWAEGAKQRDSLIMEEARFAGDLPPAEEYADIDLPLAQSLFNRYAETREEILLSIATAEQTLIEIDDDSFQMQGLGASFSDPISQSMIGRAHELATILADHQHYSSQEHVSAQLALQKQKEGFKRHLLSQIELLRKRFDETEKRLARLRAVALELIQREKASVEGKLSEIGTQLHKLPAKWRKENQLKIEKELTMQIMEGLSQLSESKVIHHHLFHIDSGPLDAADSPLEPQPRRGWLLAIIGGGSSAFFTFLFILASAMQRGLPISRPYLRQRGLQIVEGEAAFEKLALYIQPDEVVALIDGNLGANLKEALSMRGICAHLVLCSDTPFVWKKPAGCILLICSGEKEAIRSIELANRFVITVGEKRPEDVEVFPKNLSHFVLSDSFS